MSGPPVSTDLVEGATTTWSAIQTIMTNARAWANGVNDGDFAASGIRSENLVKPVIGGFPNDSSESTFQGLWWWSYGNLELANVGSLGDTHLSTRAAWGVSPKRITIAPPQVPIDSYWATPLGRTIYLPVSCHVEVNVSFDFLATGDSAVVVYPTGGGAGNTAGRFVLMSRTRSTGAAAVEYAITRTPVYPSLNATFDSKPFAANMLLEVDLLAGTHDIFLAFRRASGDTQRLHQIDVSRCLGKIEAY